MRTYNKRRRKMKRLMNISAKFLGACLFTLIAALVVTTVVPMDGFGQGAPTVVQAATKLNKTSLTLPKGSSYTLKVTGTSSKVTWKSSKTSVAAVSSKGKVTAKKAGTATISAKVGKKTYKCTVKVVNFKCNTTSISVTKGKTYQIKISSTSKKPSYKSSKSSIASVSKTGKVTGKKKGSTIITVTVGKEKLSIPVTVETPSISKTSITLSKGKTTTLKVNGTNRSVKWSSNNNSVASVDSKGTVTTKGYGQAIITAKLSDVSYTCKVVVGNAILSGLPDRVTVDFGSKKSYILTCQIAESMNVSVDNPNIVEWDANPSTYKVGTKLTFDFIGAQPGTTNVTFTSVNTGWKKVIPVTVVATSVPTTGTGVSYNSVKINSFKAYKTPNSSTPTFCLETTITNNVPMNLETIYINYGFYDQAGNELYTTLGYVEKPAIGKSYTIKRNYDSSIYEKIKNAATVKIIGIDPLLADSEKQKVVNGITTTVDTSAAPGISITNLQPVYKTANYYYGEYYAYFTYTISNTSTSYDSFKVYYEFYDETGTLLPQSGGEYMYESVWLEAGESETIAPSNGYYDEKFTGNASSGKVASVKLRVVPYD